MMTRLTRVTVWRLDKTMTDYKDRDFGFIERQKMNPLIVAITAYPEGGEPIFWKRPTRAPEEAGKRTRSGPAGKHR